MDKTAAPAMPPLVTPIDASLLDKLLSNQLSEADARRFVSGDPESTVLTLLALQQRIAASAHATGPNTPSAAIPPYAKPTSKSQGRNKLSPASVIRLAVGFPRTHTRSRLDLTGFSLGSTGARLPL